MVGCSTGGQIRNDDVTDDEIAGVALRFEGTRLRLAREPASGPEHSRRCGEAIGRALEADDLAGIFVLSDGLNVNGSELVAGITGVVGERVPVTGGLAGDGAKFRETLVAADCAPASHTVGAIGFYGPTVRIGHGSAGGWDEFGPRRLITRSRGNVLFELDGKPALDLYERYLGEDEAKGLPGTALLFPLRIRNPERPDHDIVRTILAVDRDARSMTFAGDVPEGWAAQLMRGNFDRLAAGAARGCAASGRSRRGAARGRPGGRAGELHRPPPAHGTAHHRRGRGRRCRARRRCPAHRFLFVRRDFAPRSLRHVRAAQPDHDRHRDFRGGWVAPVHKLFARQLAKARTPTGEVDLATLGELVTAAYDENDRDRRRTDHSIAQMVEELDQLNRGLECLVEERTAALREREEELHAQNLRFDTALNNMSQALTMFDCTRGLVICNPRYHEMYGLPADFVHPGWTVHELLEERQRVGTFPDDPAAYMVQMMEAITQGRPSRRAHGAGRWPHPSRRGQSHGRRRLGRDARGHHRAPERGKEDRAYGAARCPHRPAQPHAAARPAGAGARRRSSRRAACRALSRPRPFQVRQRHARPHVGDELLKTVAGRLRNCVREVDTVARVGGDEFAIIQVGVERPTDTALLARRICEAIEAPYELNGHAVMVDTSIGIAIAPSDGTEPRRAAQERRHGALRRQGRRTRDLSLLRAADGRAHEGAAHARTCAAPGARERRIRALLSAARRIVATAASPAARRWCAGIIPSAA